MELLKKYATRKYLMYGSIAGGILAVTMLIIYLTAGQGLDSLSGLSSALSSLRSLCVLYYIDFVILVILVGGYAFRIGYLKDASFMGKLLLGCNGAALLMGLFCFPAIRAVHALASGDFTAAMAYSGSMDNKGIMLVIMVLAQIAAAGISIYILFVKRNEQVEAEEAMKDLSEGAKAAGEAVSKASAAAQDHALKLSEKCKAYYKTEKGRRNTIIGGIAAAVVIVCIAGFSIYQSVKKTPIDLTSACTVTFEGVSGEGTADINCNPDYDHTNEDIRMFMSDVTYKVEKDGELKNGDDAVLKAEYSQATADSCKVKVENPEKKVKVEGLEIVYKTFAEIPKASSDKFEAAAKAALEAYIKDRSTSFFSSTKVTVEHVALIGVYYEYRSYDHTGTAHYVYRTKVTEDSKYSTEKNTDYYDVKITGISSAKETDLSEESDMINVDSIYLYEDEKTDAMALEKFKQYKTNLETIKEQAEKTVFKDERKSK